MGKNELKNERKEKQKREAVCYYPKCPISLYKPHSEENKCLSALQQSYHQTKPWCCEAAAENMDNKLFGLVMNNFETMFISLADSDKEKL